MRQQRLRWILALYGMVWTVAVHAQTPHEGVGGDLDRIMRTDRGSESGQSEPVRKNTRKVALGLGVHPDGKLITAAFEFRLLPRVLPRLTLEPALGLGYERTSYFPIWPNQDVRHRKLAFGIDARYYFLLNRRYPFEGFYGSFMADHFRERSIAIVDRFLAQSTYHTKWGLGIGGNFYPVPKFSIGACWHTCISKGEDVVFDYRGNIRYIMHRGGFVFHFLFQAGFSF